MTRTRIMIRMTRTRTIRTIRTMTARTGIMTGIRIKIRIRMDRTMMTGMAADRESSRR